MAIHVTTKVKYASGNEYWDPCDVEKLIVSKRTGDEICIEFDKTGDIRGSIRFPASIAHVLAGALKIVAEGTSVSIDVNFLG